MENYSEINSIPLVFSFAMETEELIKLVDGIYKNILDKFNPGARQMINAGKAYLKALHGATAASRLYVDAIAKLAKQAQQGTWGGSSDIGSALMRIVEVYKEIQEQQMNILKAFYVDLLVPLETNLEKDTKVVQSEQKKFLQQHKQRSETYSKAAAMMKKQRKKSRGSTKTGIAMDKELKNMQLLEEEKTKLDAFCEQSLKTAITQERRRYGFVLERQCSLAKHYLSYHNNGVSIYQQNISEWDEVAKTREFLPEAVENMFTNRLRQVTFWADEDVYLNPRSPQLDDDSLSITSQLRKTKSMDASCLDIRSIGDAASPLLSLSRAKSEYNLTSSSPSLQDVNSPQRRPKSMALPTQAPQWDIPLAKALYAYLSSGENQLSFLEGDMIALMGERTKGWQFGENLRTHCSGWFPLAYTEVIDDPTIVGFSSPTHRNEVNSGMNVGNPPTVTPAPPTTTPMSPGPQTNHTNNHQGNNLSQQPQPLEATPSQRMFGDTLHLHRNSAKQIRRVTSNNNYIPPPALPAPVPCPQIPFQPKTALTQSQSTTFTSQNYPSLTSFPPTYTQPGGLKTSTSSFNFTTNQSSGYSTHPQGARPPPMPPLPLHLQGKKTGVGVGNVSLHSSNDSGFSNDPPPQPEVDYSDDENSTANSKVPIRSPKGNKNNPKNNRELPPIHQNRKLMMGSHPNLRDPNGAICSMINDNDPIEPRKVKRTKSFWRFRRSNSEEILEGMAMWRHRDLVDPLEVERALLQKSMEQSTQKNNQQMPKPMERKNFAKSAGSERSIDSDRTMLAKEFDGNDEEIYGTTVVEPPKRRTPSFKRAEQPKLSLPHRNSELENEMDIENNFGSTAEIQDDFYDDDGDGLMRTVNRKSILQQYADSDMNSETESEIITSDDPYDCIVVNDHSTKTKKRLLKNQQNHGEKYPNVAEIGRKLEKLSKSSKYNPDTKPRDGKPDETTNMVNYNNNKNLELSQNLVGGNDDIQIRGYNGGTPAQNRPPSPAQRRSFHTFGIPEQNEPQNQSEIFTKHPGRKTQQPYYHQEDDNFRRSDEQKRSVDSKKRHNREDYRKKSQSSYYQSDLDDFSITSEQEKRSLDASKPAMKSGNERRAQDEKRTRNYYRESSTDTNNSDVKDLEKSSRNKNYYRDEYGEENPNQSRQFLPRTKLVKSSQTVMKYEKQEIYDYDNNNKNMKSKKLLNYEGHINNNGNNTYGPWYDLWGLDATTKKK